MDLLSLILLAVLAIVVLSRLSKLERKVAQQAMELRALTAQATEARAAALAAEPVAVVAEAPEPAPPTLPAGEEPAAQAVEPERRAALEAPAVPTTTAPDMERRLASQWLVWIGGAAIAMGGLLFVKYAVDTGLLSPALRCGLGLIFGLALIGGGAFVARRQLRRPIAPNYVPAALTAAGLAIAFGSIYAAFALYQLIGASLAFGALALVGLAGLGLSLRRGALVAIIGLLGSFVTPALIPSSDPSAWPFFAYLAIILAASLGILRRRDWWWRGYAALTGAGVWSLLWIGAPLFEKADIVPVALFAILVGAMGLALPRGIGALGASSGSLREPARAGQPLLLAAASLGAGLLIVAFLTIRSGHDGVALALLLLAVTLALATAWLIEGLDLLAALAAGLVWLVFATWAEGGFRVPAYDEFGGWSLVLGPEAQRFLAWSIAAALPFALAGHLGTKLKAEPVLWAAVGSGALLLLVSTAYARAHPALGEAGWVALTAGPAVLTAIAIWLQRRRAAEPRPNVALGLHGLAATWLLALALYELLDGIALTLAWSLLVPALAFSARLVPLRLLGPIALGVATVVTLRLFVAREIWGNAEHGLPLGRHFVLHAYGVPAAAFYAASRWLAEAGAMRSRVALEGAALGLVLAGLSLELRVIIAGSAGAEDGSLLELGAHVSAWLGAAYGLAHRQKLFSSLVSSWGARLLLALSVGALVLGALGALNPVLTGEALPGGAVLNALLLAYLVPALLLALLLPRLEGLGLRQAKLPLAGITLLLALAYITFEIKRLFQGPSLVIEALSDAENYAYSAAWLCFALALFVAGIRFTLAALRYAGLAVMALVTVKVFLLDMAGLSGLYRIASFIGLGLCLIGIGYLYARFVQPARLVAQPSAE